MDMSLLHPSTTLHSPSILTVHHPRPFLTLHHFRPILTLHHLRPILTVKPRVPPLQASKHAKSITSAAPSGGGSGVGRGGDMKEQTWTHEGLITESLSNGMFKVGLENGDVILGHVSGKMRQSRIKVLPGDKVKIEVSRYDSSRGRITYRLKADNSNKGTTQTQTQTATQ